MNYPGPCERCGTTCTPEGVITTGRLCDPCRHPTPQRGHPDDLTQLRAQCEREMRERTERALRRRQKRWAA